MIRYVQSDPEIDELEKHFQNGLWEHFQKTYFFLNGPVFGSVLFSSHRFIHQESGMCVGDLPQPRVSVYKLFFVWIWCHVSLSAIDIFQNIGYRSIWRKTYIINFHQNHPRTKTCPFLFDFSWKRRVPQGPPRTKQPWLTGHKQWDIIVICY